MYKVITLPLIIILGLAFSSQDQGITKILTSEFNTTDLTIPKSINFQGYLYRDDNPVDTTMDMWFGIYDDPIAGSILFQQTINNVTVTKGWFTVTLTNIPNSMFPVGGPERYLEVKAPSSGPALLPRISLVSVGYSYHAITADSAEYAKAAPLSRPITPPIYSTEIRDTTIITGKIKDGAVTSAKILDATINGVDIAKPCSLQGSVSLPNAILNIRNNGGGRGIIIDRVGGHGIYIDSTPGGSGLYVNKAYTYGVYVDSAGYDGVQVSSADDDGIRVGRAGLDGVYVDRAGDDGVNVDSVGNVGFYVNRADTGVKVWRAKMGVYVDSAGYDGVHVERAGLYGVYVDRAGDCGFYVNRSGWDGVAVDSAVYDGVYAWGNFSGGNFRANLQAVTVGLIAHAYNNLSTDTAIRAYGKGIATGGWSTGFDDGKEAPCIVSSDRTIIVSGTTKTSDGKAEIHYPAIFTENIRTDVPVRLSVTPIDECPGILAVSRNKAVAFKVTLKRIAGWEGNDDVIFDWIAIGTLKEPETSPEAKAEWEQAIKEREARRVEHEKMMR